MIIVNTNPEVLGNAMRDAINVFIREILIGRQLVDDVVCEKLDSEDVRRDVNAILKYFTEKWKTCEIDDEQS